MNIQGNNMTFPIKRGDGSSFEGLELRKSTYESSVMGLGDKISGDVYYKDTGLRVTMDEYIEFNGVRFVLVSPPTIVCEGIVGGGSDTKGMAKYSFVFYHPMAELSNMVFSDVAVTSDESMYKSHDKVFSWIGHLDDFIDKLNKNLQRTQWVVEMSDTISEEKKEKLSDVLSFSNNTIAEALKTAYDTWNVPFIIDKSDEGSVPYQQGKNFIILFGEPTNEIMRGGKPFVFRFGQGLGLKNNSRTPRNNKIVTRIYGNGSETNIPYGYPQIVWYGDEDAETTGTYPLYWGIVGGRRVKLIKHPYTRTHLMPTVYVQSVFNKVSQYREDGSINPLYDPDAELIDFYDADGTYENPVNSNAPSIEVHEFADIKPELGEAKIINARPVNDDMTYADDWDDTMNDDGEYNQGYFELTLPVLSFDLYACAAITQEMQINMRSGACIGCTFNIQVDWDLYKLSFYDSDDNFAPYGPRRDYSKFPDSRSGQIKVIVQKDKDTFGTLMPNIYQKPVFGDKFVILGISLPLSYIEDAEKRLSDAMKEYMRENNHHYFDYPLKFDEYFLKNNIDILSQIRNNVAVRFYYQNYEHVLYVKQMSVKFFDGLLPVYDITLTDDIEITLNQIGQTTEDVSRLRASVNQLKSLYDQSVINELYYQLSEKLSRKNDDTAQGNVTFQKMARSGGFKSDLLTGTGWGIWKDNDGSSTLEVDKLFVRMKAVFAELEVKKRTYSGGNLVFSAAGNKILLVLKIDGNGIIKDTDEGIEAYRCCWLMEDDGEAVENEWAVGDQARCQTFNIKEGTSYNVSNRYYWRKVLGAGSFTYDGKRYNYVDLAANISGTYDGGLYTNGCQNGVDNDMPMDGDSIVQMGNQDDSQKDRQNITEIIVNGDNAPAILQYQGVDDYSFDGRLVRGDYFDSQTGRYKSVTYGDWYVGDRDETSAFVRYDNSTNTLMVNGTIAAQSTLADGRNVNQLGTDYGNLLLNTSFHGDYVSEEVYANGDIHEDDEMFSEPLKHWEYENASIVDTEESVSGRKVVVEYGSLSQVIDNGMVVGEWYMLSFSVKHSREIHVSVGAFSKTIYPMEEAYLFHRVNIPFQYQPIQGAVAVLSFNGKFELFEPVLTYGTLPIEWKPSEKDNDKALLGFSDIDYITNAINNASTTVLGGIVLSQIIKVGNYKDRQMIQETGGMNGYYVDSDSPFTWGGGTMSQAIYTIEKYRVNPEYRPTEAEVERMAKYVVTHGGRAILTDAVLRGYIYAEGGYFKGEVNATSGVFRNVHSPNNNFVIDDDGYVYVQGQLFVTEGGRIGNMHVYEDGMYSNTSSADNPYVLSISGSGFYAGFGSNTLPTTQPKRSVSRFQNNVSRQRLDGANIAVLAEASNAVDGNFAIEIPNGVIHGFRRYIKGTTTDNLSVLDSHVFADNQQQDVTLTLPRYDEAEEGQEFMIRCVTNGHDVTVKVYEETEYTAKQCEIAYTIKISGHATVRTVTDFTLPCVIDGIAHSAIALVFYKAAKRWYVDLL